MIDDGSELIPPEKIPPEEISVPKTGAKPRSRIDEFSPQWGTTTKLVIGLAFTAICIFLLFRFLNIVGPLLLAFILAYLFFPIADGMKKYLKLPWRLAVGLIYLFLLVLLLGSLTASGLAIIEQIQSLIAFLNKAISDLPVTIGNLISTPLTFGPFVFRPDALNLDVNTISQQLLNVIQPMLTGAGTLVGSFATSAATFIGWMFFILLISYFILSESGGFPNLLTKMSLPGYAHDLQRLSDELSRIWNAFLRGQLTIVLVTILIYIFLLGGLGIKFFYGLALLAGMARFIPFVGPAVAWTTYGMVAYFQGTTLFGLPPLGYVGLVVGTAWVTDLMIDNLLSPRVMADALKVHPATVMVSALIGANLLGFRRGGAGCACAGNRAVIL